MKNRREVLDALVRKLKESLLTAADARTLGFTVYTANMAAKLFPSLPEHRAGFVIPYLDKAGKEIFYGLGRHKQSFFRYRYLEPRLVKGFRALTINHKELRYGQPSGSGTAIYLPHGLGTDWTRYSSERDKPLFITEGELKAACATKEGFPTIGLGGVWSFRTRNGNPHEPSRVVPALGDWFDWKDRKVFICYDSDAANNPEVIKAQNALARELLAFGARPFICRVPPLHPAPAKTGIDDFLAHPRGGKERFEKTVLETASEWHAAEVLHRLNEQVVYVEDPGVVLKVSNLQRMSPRAFQEHAYSDWIYREEVVTAKSVKVIDRSAPKEWIRWPHRAKAAKVTYAPAEPRVTERGELNVWKGWGCEPRKGDTIRWTRLLDFLFRGSPSRDRIWFEQWLAYPLQHPGRKLATAVIMWGLHQGTGKSSIGYAVAKIYGANFGEISDEELHGNHNEWAEHKQFIMADEIVGGESKRTIADRMKSWITRRELRLNPKHISAYTVPDCINYYFTSNHPDALILPEEDRRFFVHEVKESAKEKEFYADFYRWLDNGGASELFHHLLHLDLSGFDPDAHAPTTSAKSELIGATKSDAATWATRLREDSKLTHRGIPLHLSLFREEELYAMYKQAVPNGTKPFMRTVLSEAGIRPVLPANYGVRIDQNGWSKVYLWAVRDCERLHRMKESDIRARFLKERASLPDELRLEFGPQQAKSAKFGAAGGRTK